LITNHEKVVSFALRGVRDGEQYREDVDVAFHLVANALLIGVEMCPGALFAFLLKWLQLQRI